MYDSERLRRVREQHKTTQEVMKEKAVSSVSAIRNSGMSAAHQLQSAVATISNVSSFISIGTRFVHSFACYLLIFLCGSQKSQVHFEPAYLLVCSSFGALQSFQIFEKRFIWFCLLLGRDFRQSCHTVSACADACVSSLMRLSGPRCIRLPLLRFTRWSRSTAKAWYNITKQ